VVPLASMTNILSDDKKQQVLALGQLGWTRRRIERATGVRRETAGAYLKAAGLAVQAPGRWGHPAAKPAIEVSTDSGALPPGISSLLSAVAPPGRAPAASACARPRPRRHGDLARPRRRSRVSCPVRQRPPFCPHAAGAAACRSAPGDRDRPRGRRPGRTMATARWGGIRTRASTAGRGCSSSPWGIAARASAC
jgi:hypothetical protein